MLDTPCSEVVGRVLATHSIRQFPLHFPYRAAPCAIRFQLSSNNDSSNYQGMSLLPTTYKILPNILITRWTPRVDKFTGFRRKRSTTDHIFRKAQLPIIWLPNGEATKLKNVWRCTSRYPLSSWHEFTARTALNVSPLVTTFVDQVVWTIHKNRQVGRSLE